MGDRISMSISGDSLSDETLNQGLLAFLLRRQYEFPSWINIVLNSGHSWIMNSKKISGNENGFFV